MLLGAFDFGFLRVGEDALAELDGERGDEVGLGGRQVAEEMLELHGDLGSALVAVHAEGAGEFVGDGGGFLTVCFGELTEGGSSGVAVEEIEALDGFGEILGPEAGDEGVGLGNCFRSHRGLLYRNFLQLRCIYLPLFVLMEV